MVRFMGSSGPTHTMDTVSALSNLITEVVKNFGPERSRKYTDQVLGIQLKMNKEKAKGYDADQAKLEAWEKELTLVAQAVTNDLAQKAVAG